MNKIYKVVWNKTKNCYVVANELAKGHTRGNGSRSLGRQEVLMPQPGETIRRQEALMLQPGD